MFILAMTTSDWVAVGCVAVPIIIGWVIEQKRKADKADLQTYVDDKIKEEMQPLETKVNEMYTEHKIMAQRVEDIFKIISKQSENNEKANERIEKAVEKLDDYVRTQLEKLWDSKADKKS